MISDLCWYEAVGDIFLLTDNASYSPSLIGSKVTVGGRNSLSKDGDMPECWVCMEVVAAEEDAEHTGVIPT